MKIAITDACIFIDISDLKLTSQFFGLKVEIHTSLDVFNELYPEQREILNAYKSVGKLIVHNILEADRIAIYKEGFPNTLSNSDKTVLYLAAKLGAMVLSSDKRVRHNAKIRSIEYHGMFWIFDRLVESSVISHKEASEKLKTLIVTNVIYQNNAKLLIEMNNRLKKWEKHF